MTTVDSTPEALALHYVGIGLFSVVNNIWTLLALFTAALSFFWRLRGGLLLLRLRGNRCSVGPSHERDSIPEVVDSSSGSSVSEAATATAEGRCHPPCGEGATRGKFVAYYREGHGYDVAAAAEEEEEETGDGIGGGEAGEWWEVWEKAWRMRRKGAEKGRGWYDGLDLAVLNGSVVRLWAEDEEERVRTSSVLQSMRCVLW
ncbi:hypothetical protein MLD38_006519 [Melastoma candidum]|uniref:Uncharacterized protein n=1 Tax=Melastoma candidum TaxID=119954 RepID=A0ACB9RRX6_9MYRT|nr:hypothetical protein MLD38_006519 [Melastoma candidum]